MNTAKTIAPTLHALLERGKSFVPPKPKASVMLLSAVGQMSPAETSTAPATFNGSPVHAFWAPVAKSGRWRHPVSGDEVVITTDRMETWCRNVEEARRAGLDIPIVRDHNMTAEDNLGYVFGAKREGDQMSLLLGFVGDDARDIGVRNRLSLGVRNSLRDAKGNEYEDAIFHVAVTPVPVIDGLGHFVPVNN